MKQVSSLLLLICLALSACQPIPEVRLSPPPSPYEAPSPEPSVFTLPPRPIPSPQPGRPSFDPLNPDEWDARDLARFDAFNREFRIVRGVDDIFGDFYPGMTLEEGMSLFSQPYTECFIRYDDVTVPFRRFIFDGFILEFYVVFEDDPTLYLCSFTITSSEYSTVRGLRVGDPAETVYQLYGIPTFVSSRSRYLMPGRWFYRELDRSRDICYILVTDGFVEEIDFFSFP
jgi:hypothetical protein